jgi:hypothetical protein
MVLRGWLTAGCVLRMFCLSGRFPVVPKRSANRILQVLYLQDASMVVNSCHILMVSTRQIHLSG